MPSKAITIPSSHVYPTSSGKNPPDWGGIEELRPKVDAGALFKNEGPSACTQFSAALERGDFVQANNLIEFAPSLSPDLAVHMINMAEQTAQREAKQAGQNFTIREASPFISLRAKARSTSIIKTALDKMTEALEERIPEAFRAPIEEYYKDQTSNKEQESLDSIMNELKQLVAELKKMPTRKQFAAVAGGLVAASVLGFAFAIKDLALSNAVREESVFRTKFYLAIGADPNKWTTTQSALHNPNCGVIEALSAHGADFEGALKSLQIHLRNNEQSFENWQIENIPACSHILNP